MYVNLPEPLQRFVVEFVTGFKVVISVSFNLIRLLIICS